MIIGDDGPAVVLDARTAAWLERYTNISQMRVHVRGTNPHISAALQEIQLLAASWRSSSTGTAVEAKPEPATDSEQWLSSGQAADLLDMTSRGITKAINEGRLKATEVGGRYRISREDVEHYRAERARR